MTSKLTMTEERIGDVIKMAQEAAKIYGGEWDSALIAESPGNNVHGIVSDHIEAVVVRADDDSLHSSWVCDYLESVSPAFVIAALRELQERRKAAMDSEPVAIENFRSAIEGIGHIRRTLEETFGGLHGTHVEPDVLAECKAICDAIYAAYRHAQPAPVVPEEKPMPNPLSMYAVDAVAAIAEAKGWNACRAAMLAAAPQSPGSEPATVPGKWIPVSERLPEEGGRYWCYVEEQNDLGKSHYQWNCSWSGDRWWVESEGGGIVTHWMPLPAAPQEVNRE